MKRVVIACSLAILLVSAVAQVNSFLFQNVGVNKEFFRIRVEDPGSFDFQKSFLVKNEPLIDPIVRTAHYVCGNFSHPGDDGRCLPLALYTLRGTRTFLLYRTYNELDLAAHGEHKNEGLVTSYSYVYDRTLTGGRNICVFGPLSLQLFSYIRLFSGAQSIFLLVRADSHVESDILLTRKLSADTDTKVVAIHFDNYALLSEIEEYIGDCDVLHVREDNISHVQAVVAAVSAARVKFHEDTVPHVRTKVVWERIVSAGTPRNSASNLDRVVIQAEGSLELSCSLQWESNVYGQNIEHYNLMTDSQGFFARTFFPQELEKATEHEFVELIIGTVELFLDTVAASTGPDEHVRLTPELNMLPESASAPLHTYDIYPQFLRARDAAVTVVGAASGAAVGRGDISRLEQPIAITYTCRVFGETARGLQRALLRLGYRHVFILPEMNVELHEALIAHMQELRRAELLIQSTGGDSLVDNGGVEAARVDVLQIAIAPMEVQMLLPNYIAIQLEQIWSPFFSHFYTRYSRILSHAVGLWSFSDKLTDDLRNSRAIMKPNKDIEIVFPNSTGYQVQSSGSSEAFLGDSVPIFDSSRLFTVPVLADSVRNEKLVMENFGNTSSFQTESFLTQPLTAPVVKEDEFYLLDALIFGGGSQRRADVLYDVFRVLRERTGSTVPRDANGEQVFLDGDRGAMYITLMSYDPDIRIGYSVGSWDRGIFDDDRDYYVLRSKVIINVHSADDSSLELHRINYLTSLGKCVISERSSLDPGLDDAYEYTGYSYYNASVTRRTAAMASGNVTGGVVFVNHHKDIIPVLLELIESDRSAGNNLRREVEAQAYRHYRDVIEQNISQLDVAIAASIDRMRAV